MSHLQASLKQMKLRIRIYTIVAVVLSIIQILGYLGNHFSSEEELKSKSVPEYLGFNIFIIIAVFLFIDIYYLKKKLKNKELQNEIHSIGDENFKQKN